MPTPALDTLDQQLIELLARDARVSNRKIASELGVTEGTVRGRVKRLQQEGLIAFTAITGFEMSKRARLAFISVQVDFERVREVAQTISEIPGINSVLITMGQFNITAISLVDELEELIELSSDQILPLPGVRHVETSIAVKTVKYNSGVARITRPNEVVEEDD